MARPGVRPTGPIPTRLLPTGLLLAAYALTGLILARAVGGGFTDGAVTGLPDAGPLVTSAAPVVDLAGYALGLLVIARLLSVSVLNPARPKRIACPDVAPLALAWSGVAFIGAVLNLGVALALPPGLLLDPAVVITYGWELDTVRAGLIVATLALATGAVMTRERSALTAAGWAALGILGLAVPGMFAHAGGLGGHDVAVAAGLFHGVAMAAWLAGLAVVAVRVARVGGPSSGRSEPTLATVRLFTPIAATSVVVLTLSGVAAASARLAAPSQLLTTAYGQLVLAKAGLLGCALLAAVIVRRRLRQAPPIPATARRALAVEGGLLGCALGVAVGLSLTAFPRITPPARTLVESLTGYAEPPPFTISGALTVLAVEPMSATIGLLAGGLYLAGVVRLWRRGDHWPIVRTLCWLAGVIAAVYVTNTLLARYAVLMFSAHMVSHMVIGMLAPLLLACGGPVTLALRALRVSPGPGRGPREWLVLALHSPYLRAVSHPLIAFVLFVGGTYALYLTPLLGWAMGSHLGHLLMTAHFLVAGYLFFWIVLGVDARVVPVGYPVRLLMVVAAAALHGIFGVLVYSTTTPLGGGWFLAAAPGWLADPLADQRLGGGLAWSVGEIPAIIALLIVAVQWAAADGRAARRRDRQVQRAGRDVELDAYNAMLARMNASAGGQGGSAPTGGAPTGARGGGAPTGGRLPDDG